MILRFLRLFAAFTEMEDREAIHYSEIKDIATENRKLRGEVRELSERINFRATTFDMLNSEFDRVRDERDQLKPLGEANQSLAAEVAKLKDQSAGQSKMLSIMREERDLLADQLGKAIIRQANPDCPACTRKGIRITELLSNNDAIKEAFRGEIERATHARILAEEKLAAYKKAHPARKAKK